MTPRRGKFVHRKLDAGACLIALAMGGATFGLGVWPAMHAQDNANRLAGQVQLSNAQLEQAQSEYRQVRGRIDRTRRQLDALAVVLDAPDQLAARQAQIGRVFGEAGVSVGQLSVGTIEEGRLVDVIPMHLSGTGAFPDVVAAMHAIRTVFPDMAVTTFQIGGAGGAGDDGVGFSFGLAWYVVGAGKAQG